MATAQGIVRFGGTPIEKVHYTAYYRNNSGNGSPGPGNGFRDSQWMSGVYLTESSGQYTAALSSDNFLGAGATVNANDTLVVIFWQDTNVTPAEVANHFYENQSRTDGSGGDHGLGFKYDNGAAASANYGTVDRFYYREFTMTSGQSWQATPGGVGGDENGDVTLVLNAGPSATIAGGSTAIGSPVATTRAASTALNNTSADTLTNRQYQAFGQTFFQQSSAAHNPTGGTQTADGSDVDGSVFAFSLGTTYGQAFGTPAGGDTNTASSSTYEGPDFDNHSHTFPAIDIYGVQLTVKDDNSAAPLTDTQTFYYQTFYNQPSLSFGGREYVTWAQFLVDPTAANANWSNGNPNTINDVVKLALSIGDPDANVGQINSGVRGGIESAFTGSKVLDGTGAFVINETGIGDGLPGSAPFGFLVVLTQSGQPVRHSYEITAASANSITIDTRGSTETYTSDDWWMVATEPTGGTMLQYDWEYNQSGAGWQQVGTALAPAGSALGPGTTLTLADIGQDIWPGMWLRVVDGPARGDYQIASVPNDDQIVLAGVGLSVAINSGNSYSIGFANQDLMYPQLENDGLNFRVQASYSDGWPDAADYIHSTSLSTITNNGSVDNIDPQAITAQAAEAGGATTYTFDGGQSYGTQTSFEQDTTFVSAHTLDGTGSYTITDTALDTTNLRDGHAWLLLLDADQEITNVYPITDLDRETPDNTVIVIDTLGDTTAILPGTAFRTTNAYEIEGGNDDNDIVSYSWELRTASSAQTQPTNNAEFVSRFPDLAGTGSGEEWSYTFDETSDGLFACIELTVTDAEGATHTEWTMFTVSVTAATSGRRGQLEWD